MAMKPWPGLTGPTYAFLDPYAAVERCVNFIPTVNESGEEGKFRLYLQQSPSNVPFGPFPVPLPSYSPAAVSCVAGMGLLAYEDTLYAINAILHSDGIIRPWFYSVSSSGAYTYIGAITGWQGITQPASMSATGASQIFMCVYGTQTAAVYNTPNRSGGAALYSLPPSTGFLGANYSTFQDGYILCGYSGNRQFQISGTSATPVGDVTLWSASNVSIQAGQQDYINRLISAREYVRVFGERRSQVYYNAGASGYGLFPFQNYNETFIETGLAAINAADNLGDSLIWIGQDDRGIRACWRDFGFAPQRVSTYAVEQQWQSYATVSDAVSFPYLWNGNLLWRVTFLTAQKSWEYNATASQLAGRPIWLERTYGGGNFGQSCRPELYHAFAYGLHIVMSGYQSTSADNNPGGMYKYGNSYSDVYNQSGSEAYAPQIPVRVLPHLSDTGNRLVINRFQYAGKRPMTLNVSTDGGVTFGSSIAMSQMVNNPQISYINRLGASRDFVLMLTGDGTANDNSIVAGYVDARECAN